MDIIYGILGRTALRIDDDLDDAWGSTRLRAMLATLLVHAGRAVPVETLVAWVWPEDGDLPQHPTSTFHTYATRIRTSLRLLAKPPTLHAENGTYRLDADRSSIDYGHFRMLLGQARGHARANDHRTAAEYADNALRLWRGRALDDLKSEPARAWRTRVLRDEWLPANVVYVEAHLELGEFGEALTRLDDLKADYEDDVTLAKLRMSALCGLSRFSEETAYYIGMRRRLLGDADEQAAATLREHHEGLREKSEPGATKLLREATSIPRQLPHDIAGFVGRERLLGALDAAMRGDGENDFNRVVVLDGMAGVGKTALAVHWGHRARHNFPGGDLFVDLRGFSDSGGITPATVVDKFLLALGYPLDGDMSVRSKQLTLERLLTKRRALVVLDNALNTAHVKDLIALLSNCCVIVTSRQQLTTLHAATGASRVHVEPLTDDEADLLLSTQLGRHDDANRTVRSKLAKICGGLPLVITVLAQHVISWPAAHLGASARQLDRRQLLTDIGEDGDGSVTAESLLLWSYRALGDAERQLFRLLSVNPGPDIGEAVASACDGRTKPAVKRSLRVLVASHLLTQPDEFDRYRFHDLIREFARRRLEQEEAPDARKEAEVRLLGHYLAVATQAHRMLYPGNLVAEEAQAKDAVQLNPFVGPEQATTWFDRERLNLLAAIDLAVHSGHHEHAWLLTDVVCTFLDRQGYYQDSRVARELSVASARAAGHRIGEASSLVGLGMVQMILGNHNEAQASLESALRVVEEDGNERGQSATLHHLGRLASARGDHAMAIHFYRRCLDIAEHAGDVEGLCWTKCRLAVSLHALDLHEDALNSLRESLVHAESLGDDSAYASALVEIGSIHRDCGDHASAKDSCERALEIVEHMPIPDLAVNATACVALAEIHHEQDETETSIRYVLDAINVADKTQNTAIRANAQEVYGNIQLGAGELSGAAEAWHIAIDGYQHIGNIDRVSALQEKIDSASPDLPT